MTFAAINSTVPTLFAPGLPRRVSLAPERDNHIRPDDAMMVGGCASSHLHSMCWKKTETIIATTLLLKFIRNCCWLAATLASVGAAVFTVRCHLIECGYSFSSVVPFGFYSVRFYCVAFVAAAGRRRRQILGALIFDYIVPPTGSCDPRFSRV